jgi:hypothetical protein
MALSCVDETSNFRTVPLGGTRVILPSPEEPYMMKMHGWANEQNHIKASTGLYEDG